MSKCYYCNEKQTFDFFKFRYFGQESMEKFRFYLCKKCFLNYSDEKIKKFFEIGITNYNICMYCNNEIPVADDEILLSDWEICYFGISEIDASIHNKCYMKYVGIIPEELIEKLK